MPFSIIVGAHSTNRAIGALNKIPWKCRTDMNFFKETTSFVKDPNKRNAVIMGRKTFESLPAPLPNRLNVVLKGTVGSLLTSDSVVFSNDFDAVLNNLEQDPTIETIFVIGGSIVYKQALTHPKCETIYLNMVHVVCDLSESDAFFPEIDPNMYELVDSVDIDVTVTNYIYTRL
jgi:dihydrofolate reductase/thymidylate synthase